MTDEIKKKISNSLLGNKNPSYGKPRSEEAKKKCSDSQIGSKNHYFDHNIYHFHHLLTKEKFIGTRL